MKLPKPMSESTTKTPLDLVLFKLLRILLSIVRLTAFVCANNINKNQGSHSDPYFSTSLTPSAPGPCTSNSQQPKAKPSMVSYFPTYTKLKASMLKPIPNNITKLSQTIKRAMSSYNISNLPRISREDLAALIHNKPESVQVIDVRDNDVSFPLASPAHSKPYPQRTSQTTPRLRFPFFLTPVGNSS